jgi:Calcineurin-like phosphoesterase
VFNWISAAGNFGSAIRRPEVCREDLPEFALPTRHLLPLILLLVVAAAQPSTASAPGPLPRAALDLKRCDHADIEFTDVRVGVHRTTCVAAHRLVRRWLRAVTRGTCNPANDFCDVIRVRGWRCVRGGTDRVIRLRCSHRRKRIRAVLRRPNTRVLAAAGDIAKMGPGKEATAKLLDAVDPDVVAALGDLAYDQGTLDEFMTLYDPTWGRHKGKTKPAVGNHEYLTPGAAGYFDYFNGVGVATGPAGERGKGYYAYDLGAWRFYVLNSTCTPAGGCGATSPQTTWLRNDLAANPRRCVGAYWHTPRFSAGQYPDDADFAPFWQVLYDAGAELVLAASDHLYQRYVPMRADGTVDQARGIREFVAGTGGADHSDLRPRADRKREAANDDTFGVIKLTLHPDSYDWRFLPEAGKTYTDSGTAACH